MLNEKKQKKISENQENYSSINVRREEGQQNFPSSFLQKKFWYVEQMAKESSAYNTSGYVQFKGSLNSSNLKKAFNEVIKSEEVLRSSFIEKDGELVVHLKELAIDDIFEERDCTDRLYSSSERIEMMTLEGRIPFDLSQGNLIRLICYKFQDTDWIGQIVWHHIVSDGYSSSIFIEKLLKIYEQLTEGHFQRTNQPNVQFYDAVVYSKNQHDTNKYEKQLEYWKNALKGSTMKCEIPKDYIDKNEITYNGDRVFFPINQQLKTKIEEVAQTLKVTKFAIFMSALKLMIHKYNQQNDIIIGTPVLGRNRQEYQELIGCFINMLPIRSTINKELLISDYIKSENTIIMEALANQDIAFDYIVEQMAIQTDIYSTPIYQVVFSYEGNVMKDISMKGLDIEFSELNLKTAKVDLALEVNETVNGFDAWFEYKTDKFSKERIEKLSVYYSKLLEDIVTIFDRKVKDFELITREEKQLILDVFNKPISADFSSKTIPEMFEAVVLKYPDKLAVICDGESFTYKELNRKANQVARYLQRKGVSKKMIVAVLMEKSLEAVVTFLAILKTGAIYLPLDPTYPEERRNYILNDSETSFVVTNDDLNENFENSTVITINDSTIESESNHNLNSYVDAEDLAYIIYTSGTTGKPKGVMVEHAGVFSLKEYFCNEYKINTSDIILQFANLVFDASIWEFTMGILTGAALCVVTKEVILDPLKFMEALTLNNVTVATLPPHYWQTIQKYKPDFRLLITAGSEANARMLEELNGDTIYYNAYGPTETTVCATAWKYERNNPLPDLLPIGTPISNMQVYIMHDLTLCGIGTVGELCVAGVGVARGYLNNEELSAEKFQPNPFGKGRLYRTGDHASWKQDGTICFQGRIDTQVKIHGHRIEMGEVEKTLLSISQIKEVVVSKEKDHVQLDQLIAYIVVEDQLEVKTIREELLKYLPNYMIPAHFYKVPEIPLNLNGKVDLPKLSDLGIRIDSEHIYISANTDAEKMLSALWCECLGVETVSIRDDFFELGGDSIACMQVISKAAEQGIKLELRSFYEDRCIHEMAKHMDSSIELRKKEQGETTGEFSLTPIQNWFISQSFADPNYWNQTVMLKVNTLDVKQLNQALNEVRKQHDLLRAKLIKNGSVYKMDILEFEEQQVLQIVNVQDDSEENEAIRKFQQSIDINKGHAFKALLIKGSFSDQLVLTAHHLVCDAVSYRYIIEDLFDFYEQLRDKKTIHYPLKSSSFIQWEKKSAVYAQETKAQLNIKWWQSQEILSFNKLPKDFSYGSGIERYTEVISHEFSQVETDKILHELPKNYSINTKELIVASLAIVLKQWGDHKTYPIFMESHGRNQLVETVDITRTVGWFTQLYPFVMEIKENSSLEEIIKTSKKRLAEVEKYTLEYLLLPEEERKAMINLERESLIFNYLGVLDNTNNKKQNFKIVNGKNLHNRSQSNQRPFLIDITAFASNRHLIIEIAYSNKIYKETTIRNLLDKLITQIMDCVDFGIKTEATGLFASDFSDVETDELDFILAKFNE